MWTPIGSCTGTGGPTPTPTATPTATATATGTPAAGAPATPTLSIQTDQSQGNGLYYIVSWNIYYGTAATSWQLLENGSVIYSGAGTTSGSYEITTHTYGTWVYQVIVSNSAGSTYSAQQSFTDGGASPIMMSSVDSAHQATQITIPQGTTSYTLSIFGETSPSFTVVANNSSVISASASGSTLTVKGLQAGRAGVVIKDSISGDVRYVGFRVLTSSGQAPGLPSYVAIGSVSEDTTADVSMWEDFSNPATNKRMDIRYIYLNGGPTNGWTTWTNVPGGRATTFIRNSQMWGMIPFFVWYNIPAGSEGYSADTANAQSTSYMTSYFQCLQFFLGLVQQSAGGDTVGIVIEPDFIGYQMQNSGGKSPVPLTSIAAATSAAYSSGVLTSSDPQYPNTIAGLIQAINYTIHKNCSNCIFGWQFNLWASPGITVGIPSNGLMHLTDTMGISAGRTAIANEAQQIANYYLNGSITSNGASFISIDKYGLDAGANMSGNDPSTSAWFWNADQWNNYLLFTETLHAASGLPVILWQLPVGHINTSQATDPYTGGLFPALTNASQTYEDSAPDFFLGDTFDTGGGTRLTYFSTNLGGDTLITSSGNLVTWKSHVAAAKSNGVTVMLFGAGVGSSTQGVGSPPTDNYWWMNAAQQYLKNPVSLP